MGVGALSPCIFFMPHILSISRSCELYLQNILEPLLTMPPATTCLGHHYLSPRPLQFPPMWSPGFRVLPLPLQAIWAAFQEILLQYKLDPVTSLLKLSCGFPYYRVNTKVHTTTQKWQHGMALFNYSDF